MHVLRPGYHHKVRKNVKGCEGIMQFVIKNQLKKSKRKSSIVGALGSVEATGP